MTILKSRLSRFCFLALFLLIINTSSKAQTTLSVGDIAFSGYVSNAAVNDQFSFVILTNITTNTVIRFSDFGWRTGTSSFNSGAATETEMVFTAGGNFNAGTEIIIDGLTATLAVGGSAGTLVHTTGAQFNPTFSLASTGDQIFAYQGSFAAPNFIAGIQMNVEAGATAAVWDGPAAVISGQTSEKPAALTTGTNAFWSATEFDNGRFNCGPDVSTAALARAALNNTANWTLNNTNPPGFTLPTGCNYMGILSSPPSFTLNPVNTTVCQNGSTSFTVTATGATSYQWQVDQGSGFANIVDGGVYSGATTTTLNLTNVPVSFNGYIYRNVATNGSGSTNSTGGTLTVTALPVNPTLAAKVPATATVADGTPVSATFNAGSGGSGCTDDYRYTTNGGNSYTAYTPGTPISTTGLAAANGMVFIEGRRAGCATCPNGYVVLASWVVTPLPAGATTLAAGDIAFSGYSADHANDYFSFVLLKNIGPGTTLNFTDNGWQAGALTGTEGTVTWTSNASYSAGTEILISGLTATLAGGGSAGTVTGTVLSLTTAGDQILAYTGTAGSPTFISGIHMNVDVTSTAANWDGALTGTSASALPPGLITGTNAFWIGIPGDVTSEVDNAMYGLCSDPRTLGPHNTLRAALNNPANWTKDDLAPVVLPTGCPYLGVGVSPPTITTHPSPQTVCEGGNTTFTFAASGATSLQWQVDQGSGFNNVVDGGVYSGATTGTLTLTGVPGSFNGYIYRGVATNASGSTNSNPATLTVTPLPVNPTLNAKTPAANNVPDGTNVSATFNAGSGGTTCTDDYRYTTNGGASYLPYTPGSNISTTGVAAGSGWVFIEGRRAGCASLCQNNYVVLASWYVTPLPAAPTTLNAGDIAFSSYAAVNDIFSFVLLRNIGPNTVVNFTDNGWQAGALTATEQTITWTSPATPLVAGTEITISGLTATRSGGGPAGTVTGTALSLTTSGDQILAYRGTAASPTFITGIHMNVEPGTTAAAWDGATVGTSASALPTGLITGTNAIWIGTPGNLSSEFDNSIYGNCSGPGVLGPLTGLRAALNNQANWISDNNTPPFFTAPSGCNFLGVLCPTITVTNPANANGTVNVAFSETFTASGGTGPYTFSTLSTLPTGITLSSAGVLSGTPTQAGTFPITVTAVDAGGCSGTGSTYTLVIGCPAPVLGTATPASQTICSGATITTIVLAGAPAGATYNWTRDNAGTVTGIAASGSGNISGALTNTTTAPVTVTFTITPTYFGSCTGTPYTATVLVNPTPDAIATPASQPICNGATITTIVITGGVSGTVFNWTRNNTVLVTGIAASGSGNISGALTNTTNAPQVVTFTITPTANGCPGTPVTAQVLVAPTPQVNPVSNIEVCAGASIPGVNFTTSTVIAPVTYSWTNDNTAIGLAAAGSGSIPQFTATNATNAPLVANISVTPYIVTPPFSFTNSSNIAIPGVGTGPAPASPYPSNIVVAGLPGTVGKVTVRLLNYSHTFPDDVDVLLVGPGGQNALVLSDVGGTNDVAGVNVTLDGDASANLGDAAVITTGTYRPTNFDNTTDAFDAPAPAPLGVPLSVFNGTNPNGTWSLYVRDDAGVDIGAFAGGWELNISLNSGCTGPAQNFTITVNPTPDAVATPSTQTICSGANITPIVLTGNVAGTTFNWTRDNAGTVTGIAASGSGDISGALVNTTNAPITVTFTITPTANGCPGAPITADVIVNPTPDAVATPASQSICSGSAITTIALTGAVSGTTFNWTRDNTATVTGIAASGSGDISGTLTNTTASAVTVTFTITPVANGCPGTPITATVTVNPLPTVNVTGGGDFCSGSTVVLTANASGGVTYSWSTGATTPTISVTASGVYSVTVTAGSGCTATASAEVHIGDYIFNGTINTSSPTQNARLFRDGVVNTCASPKVAVAPVAGTFYYATHSFTNPQSVPVCATVTLLPQCVPGNTNLMMGAYLTSFNPADITQNYAGDPGLSTGIPGSPRSFTVTVPAGATMVINIHESAGGHTGCGDYVLTIDMPRATPGITATPSNTVCEGTPITLTASAANTYLWSPGGATTQSINPASVPASSGTYSVTLGYGNHGCSAGPVSTVLTVNPAPTVSVTGGGDFCGGSTVVLTANASPGVTYLWSTGATTPTASVTASGVYTVTVTDALGCQASASAEVHIGDYIFNGTINTSSPTQNARLFRDGVVNTCASPKVPVAPIAGTFYYATHSVTNPQSVPVCATVTLMAQCVPGNTNLMMGAYLTSFNPANITQNYAGDPGLSTGIPGNPTSFTVTIPAGATLVINIHESAGGHTGCGDYVLTVDIPRATPGITVTPSTTVCEGTPITLTASAANTYLWSPGGATTQSINPASVPASSGAYSVVLGYGNHGCTANASTNITINPNPTATATPASQITCSGQTITTIAITGTLPGTVFNWTRDNTVTVTGIAASGSGNISGALTNPTASPITVTFTITPTLNGCNGTPVTATVTVNPVPDAVATPSSQTICSGTAITTIVLTGTVPGTVFNWTRDNTATVTGIAASGSGNISGSLTNTTNAPVTVTFTITPTAAGCTPGSPITATVLVNPTPVATVPANAAYCHNVTVNTGTLNFTSNVAGTTFAWTNSNTAIGLAASGNGNSLPTFTATNPGTAPISGTITVTPTANGCPGAPVTFTITVNPIPNAVATPSSQTICSANPITTIVLSGAVSGTTYNWTRNNTVNVTGIAASGSGNISGTLTNTTNTIQTVTFTITPTANGCTGTPITATVTVNPTPGVVIPNVQVIITGNGGFADEISWTLTNALNNVVLSGGPYPFNPPPTPSATTPSVNAPFTFFIEAQGAFNDNTVLWEVRCNNVVVANGCIRGTSSGASCTSVGTLTVPNIAGCNPLQSQTICSGTAIAPITLTGTVAGTTFNWTRDNTANVTGIAASGTGTISGTLTNTTNVPQTVVFTITPTANGCNGTPVTVSILVNPTPNVVGTPASQTICSGTAITPIVLTGNVAGTTYTWVRNNTANITGIAASGSGTPISGTLTNTTTSLQTTTFTITPTANGCVGPTSTVTVDVHAPLIITCPANITVNALPNTCTAPVTFAATVTGTPTPTVTYSHASGSLFPIGTTTVTVTATNLCATVSCQFTITVIDVQIPVISQQPVNQTVCVGSSATFTVVSTFASSYQWQQWNGSAWVNIAGATASTLTLNNVTHAMNAGSYRVQITGPCGTVTTSNHAVLYVNPLPTVTVNLSNPPIVNPVQTVTITATVNPGGGTFVWFKNNVVIPGATGNTLGPLGPADVGFYKVTYTDLNGCSATSNTVEVKATPSTQLFVYPNPNTGQFNVRFYNAPNEVVTIQVFNSNGQLVYRKQAQTQLAYTIIDVNLGANSRLVMPGMYIVELLDSKGVRVGTKQIIVNSH